MAMNPAFGGSYDPEPRATRMKMSAFPDYGDRINSMTMIEPGLNPEPLTEASAPYEPMLAVREWGAATSDPKIPGSVRYIEEKDAYSRKKNMMIRIMLIGEEYKELMDELLDVANGTGDRSKVAKELADVLYVIYGTADDLEIPLPDVFNAVHLSNMTKVGEDGKVERRRDGKILKGPDYLAPDVDRVLLGDLFGDLDS